MKSTGHKGILLSLLAFLMVYPKGIQAQDKVRYTGPFQVGSYQGEADYYYRLINGDTVLDGSFVLERSSLGEFPDTRDSTFLISGTFRDDFAEDFWKFEFGAFESGRRGRVVDYQYRVTVSGIQEEAAGVLKNGRPDGAWEYLIQEIEDSQVQRSIFSSKIDFSNGVPRGSFVIETEQGSLIGRFLQDGFAHDEWALFFTQEAGTSEKWNFLNGILQNIQITREGQTSIYEFFGNRIPNEKVVNLDPAYLQALTLYLPVNDTTGITDLGISGALRQNAGVYKKIDDILSALGKSSFEPHFRVKLPYFPLDSLEHQQLESLVSLYDQSRTISEGLLNDSQLNLLKLTDDRAMYLYGSVRALSSTYLDPLAPIIRSFQDGTLEYIPRDELILRIWPDARPSTTVAVTMGEEGTPSRTFTGPGSEGYDFTGNGLSSVSQMCQYALVCLDSVQNILNVQLTTEKRQQALITLEEKMVTQELALKKLLDSLQAAATGDRRLALQNIGVVADAELSRYAAIQDPDTNMEMAKELSACFEDMERLALAVGSLPQQEMEISEVYKDAVWNPFMAVIMDEEVKKRITNAYRKDLVPFMLKMVRERLSCDNASDLTVVMQQVYERMLELREEDTSRLERKLRRERDPEVILELLEVKAGNLF